MSAAPKSEAKWPPVLERFVNDRLAQFRWQPVSIAHAKAVSNRRGLCTRGQQIVHASSTPFVIFDFRFSIFRLRTATTGAEYSGVRQSAIGNRQSAIGNPGSGV